MIGFATRATRRVTHMKQELLTLPGHLSLYPVLSEVRVARCVIFFVIFCISGLNPVSFGNCIVCLSATLGL
jgi:hypothetical protein